MGDEAAGAAAEELQRVGAVEKLRQHKPCGSLAAVEDVRGAVRITCFGHGSVHGAADEQGGETGTGADGGCGDGASPQCKCSVVTGTTDAASRVARVTGSTPLLRERVHLLSEGIRSLEWIHHLRSCYARGRIGSWSSES